MSYHKQYEPMKRPNLVPWLYFSTSLFFLQKSYSSVVHLCGVMRHRGQCLTQKLLRPWYTSSGIIDWTGVTSYRTKSGQIKVCWGVHFESSKQLIKEHFPEKFALAGNQLQTTLGRCALGLHPLWHGNFHRSNFLCSVCRDQTRVKTWTHWRSAL